MKSLLRIYHCNFFEERITDINLFTQQKFIIVLEEDGTVVDKAFWESVEAQQRLMVLKEGDSWQAPPTALPNIIKYSKGLSSNVDSRDSTDSAAAPGPAHHTIHMFIELQNNPAGLALFNLDNLEVIKDIDLDDILNNEATTSYGLDKEFCKRIQDMSIELYVKKRTEADAMEYINLLKEHNFAANIK